jgi:hypothetical protein
MTAFPEPSAVTSPAVAPGAPEELTGKTSGMAEIQLTGTVGHGSSVQLAGKPTWEKPFVMSIKVGAVEKVP